ncbi:ATP-binding protein [uncultured Jatrophihabitans sp.]|uniref:sensor histidine kinase n=1 Tax=uncultured Jatrophihabitans sp. TaxID=1610747 RepID=UPI0035CB0160
MTPTAPVAAEWTLRSRLGRAFTVVAVVVLLSAALAVLASIRFVRKGNDLVDRWQPALSASKQLYNDFLVEQGALRSFLITGQAVSLQPYTAGPAIRAADIRTVRRLASDRAEVVRALRDFQAAVVTWEQRNAAPLIEKRKQGVAIVSTKETRDRLARVTAAGDAVGTALDSAISEARNARNTAGAAAAAALAVALAMLVVAGLVVWRGLHHWVLGPVEQLGAQTRTVASGDLSRSIVPSGPAEMVHLARDVEAMRAQIVQELARAEDISEDLRRQSAELERSNGDLQQFAYVASHDLSEPLRKVSNFCQLLERQYSAQLDDRARQYIDFAVDGAKRMQTLINDLLALSRVGRTTESFVPVDLGAVLDQAVATLSDQLDDTGGTVERLTPLPTVDGDRSLLSSLMQNLVGNALKYHRDGVSPVVRIGAEQDGRDWTITVADNGIGIDPQYAERIFAVFQRLHLRDQYGGTGIGLALCRRIVDFHGGHIQLDTTHAGEGATFVFSLPEGQRRARSAT